MSEQNTPNGTADLFKKAWRGFQGAKWTDEVNVREFIQNNYTQYDGNEDFLAAPTEATDKLWGRLQELQKEERKKGGVLECETEIVSSLTSYGPGYIDESLKDLETIVGLQTDKPLKRAFMPYGGIKMAEEAAETYGYKVNEKFHKIFTEYHKTHNQAVFDAYTPEMKAARHCHIVTGLPDTYGRGRIVGDYRRVALYGIDFLIEEKKKDLDLCGNGAMYDEIIRQREEIAEQIRALKGMKEMAKIYGYDISGPATNAKEAIQWLYFGYLAAVKTQNGAAMSVGRISTFIDIYVNRDLEEGTLTESQAQELIDHMTMKFRMVKFARIPSYNQLFSGDPVWATLEVAGLGQDGRAAFTPFAPGATPSYGAEQNGLLASLNSVAKLPYEYALDGISNTETIAPGALGHSEDERKNNLVHVLDGYFDQGAHHLNVNVFGLDKLKDAMEHPEKPEYANFTIRVSGYAVKFIDLTREQQLDVIARTCHEAM